MNVEGVCAGCGRDCLGTVECSCGRREMIACEDCLESDVTLVCGKCRHRAARAVAVGLHPCLAVVLDEAGEERDLRGGLPVKAPVAA